MAARTLVLILGLALVQTVSAQAQDLKVGDEVKTPNYTGTVTEVINKDQSNEQVRVETHEEIKSSAIYGSGEVEKVETKKLSARERRLQKAQESNFVFTGISLPKFGVDVGVGGIGFGSHFGRGR